MIHYLLDTNILIDALKGKGEVIDLLQKLHVDTFFISVITIAEYTQGSYRIKHPSVDIAHFDNFLSTLNSTVLPITGEIAHMYGKLQADYSKKGRKKPIMDLFIAATCLIHDLTLVTANHKDFAGIKGLKLYKN